MSAHQEYQQAARKLASYLAARQTPQGAFPGPDHYGRAFAARLWSGVGEDFAPCARRALASLAADLPPDHGEFNAAALLGYPDQEAVASLLARLRFGTRHSANWMLLRAACRAQPGPWHSPRQATLEARAALLRYGRGALIYDRPGALSHTYHAFCGSLLVDLAQHLGAEWAHRAAGRAARAMLPFIEASGDALRVGRGREQIFGYGALLHLLHSVPDDATRSAADRVFAFLLGFQRADGSFPLVLNVGEPPEPWTPDASRLGWHDYNRYADYLPFLGVYLLKAAGQATR